MRNRRSLAAVLSFAAITALSSTAPAFAEVGASGTRLAIGNGAPRFYMTYGHIEEPELYAPILPELGRLGIMAQRRADSYTIICRGKKVAEWPVVTSRDDVPETGETPCVLAINGNVFLPLRQLSDLCGFDVRWDKKTNMVSLVADGTRTARTRPPSAVPAPQAATPTRPAPSPAAPVAVPPAPGGTAALTGIELAASGAGVEVRVQSSARIRAIWKTVKSPLPVRVVIDFPGAQWTEGIDTPNAVGPVKEVRIGQFESNTARLVLEVPSPAVKVTRVEQRQDGVVAVIGSGPAAPGVVVSPDTAEGTPPADVRVARIVPRLPSRQGIDPRLPRPVIPIEPGSLPAGALTGKVICLDAGHGGHSSGAQGLFNFEKDLCLKMTQQLKEALEACGASVVMTRDSDVYVSLEDRCAIANRSNADLFISIHCNSMPKRNTASGSETYYFSPQSLPLAQALHRRLVGSVQGRDGDIRNRRFYVVRNTTMPSVLLEIAYINNTEDEKLLADSQFHLNLAQSLAQGVIEYFGK